MEIRNQERPPNWGSRIGNQDLGTGIGIDPRFGFWRWKSKPGVNNRDPGPGTGVRGLGTRILERESGSQVGILVLEIQTWSQQSGSRIGDLGFRIGNQDLGSGIGIRGWDSVFWKSKPGINNRNLGSGTAIWGLGNRIWDRDSRLGIWFWKSKPRIQTWDFRSQMDKKNRWDF